MKLDIVQVAYHVTDIRQAALDMVASVGAGPFFINEHIKLNWAQHRGAPTDFVHSSAYGQWGEIMVELFRQEDDVTSTPYRDMFKAGEEGLHHTAMMVPDMEDAFAHFEAAGMPVVTRCGMRQSQQVDFAFIDARARLGHMIEIYPRSQALVGFYQMVRDASVGWDGDEPLRAIGALLAEG